MKNKCILTIQVFWRNIKKPNRMILGTIQYAFSPKQKFLRLSTKVSAAVSVMNQSNSTVFKISF